MSVPVLTIDGPAGSGKGTVARAVALALGWRYLDSGLPYRVLAATVSQSELAQQDSGEEDFSDAFMEGLALFLEKLCIVIEWVPDGSEGSTKIYCNQLIMNEKELRLPEVSCWASRLSALPMVRAHLMEMQRQQARAPGLVTDGRDMGTVIFPEAAYKVFLDASPEERAKRRYNQLKAQGNHVNLRRIQEDLEARDRRDRERAIAPTVPADDALIIDSTEMDSAAVIAKILDWVPKRGD